MRFLLPALLAGLVAGLFVLPAVANEVWRTVDDRGLVVYSDRPLSTASVLVRVEAAAGASSAAAGAGDDRRQVAEQPRGNAADEEALAAARAEQADLWVRACQEAREAVKAYETAPRLFQELPNGGRRYLTDEELVQVRLEARQAVADFCTD